MSRLDAIADWAEKPQRAEYDAHKLAEVCLVSSSHLRRYFASTFGKPPQRLLNELRLWHAARLLCIRPELPVKEVARLLHFADKSQLCHQFKSYHGLTPLDFGRLYRRRLAKQTARLKELLGIDFDPDLLPLTPWEMAERNLFQKIRTP